MITPSFKISSFDIALPRGVLTVTSHLLALKCAHTALRGLPLTTRMGFTIAVLGFYKCGLDFNQTVKNHESSTKSNSASSYNNGSVANSPLEHQLPNSITDNTNCWYFSIENYLTTNYDDLQITIICCIGLLLLVVFIFSFLILSILSKHYIQKIKPFIEKYPKLNTVYLFYSNWNEKVLIPVRILFITFIYVNLILCINFLIIICKVFFNS